MSTEQKRLEFLRGELRAERISYGELAELRSLAAHIAPGDVELLEAAGVLEFQEETIGDKIHLIVADLRANHPVLAEFIAAQVLAEVCGVSTAVWKDILSEKLASELYAEARK